MGDGGRDVPIDWHILGYGWLTPELSPSFVFHRADGLLRRSAAPPTEASGAGPALARPLATSPVPQPRALQVAREARAPTLDAQVRTRDARSAIGRMKGMGSRVIKNNSHWREPVFNKLHKGPKKST